MSSLLFASTVAAVHAAFGRDCVYRPPSGADIAGLRVMVSDASETDDLAGQRMIGARQREVEVMAADVAAPAVSGRFVFADGAAVIVGKPSRKDPDGLVWSCLCRWDAA